MQPPVYDPNIPEKFSDSLATTQPQLLDNFLSLFNAFQVNHVALDALTEAGNHTIIQLLQQNNAIQTNVSEIAAFTRNVVNQSDQVFLKYQGDGQEFQYTNYQLYSLQPTPTQIKYFTFLPGKLLVYFGIFTSLNAAANILDLSPYVSRNIITMSMGPNGNFNATNMNKPSVILLPAVNGIIQGFSVTANPAVFTGAPQSYYYIVLSNL